MALFWGFLCLFYELRLIRGIYFCTDFCHYSEWLGLPFSKNILVLNAFYFFGSALHSCGSFPFQRLSDGVSLQMQHMDICCITTNPFSSCLFDFDALLAMGVLSFFTVENLLWWSQLKVLSLGGFPGKTFWLLVIFHFKMFAGWIQLVSVETSRL